MARPSLEDFLSPSDWVSPKPPPIQHPKGFEPGLAIDKEGDTVVCSGATTTPPNWPELMESYGVAADDFEVVEVRSWDSRTKDGVVRLSSYKAKVRTGRRQVEHDYSELVGAIRKHKAKAPTKPGRVGRAVVVGLGDLQLGKAEGGGTEAIVRRVLESLDETVAFVKQQKPERVVLACLGDLIENCAGHYAEQAHRTDLHRRDQEKVAYELIVHITNELAKVSPHLTVSAVPGNHGENRQGSKSFTDHVRDNSDLAVVEIAGRIMQEAGVDNVNFVISDTMHLTMDVCGVILGTTHGHAKRRGDIHTWWAQQALGRQPIGDAQVLLTGHYHHLVVSEKSGRTWIQIPAMDGGSEWWTDQTGQSSEPALIAFGIGEGYGPRGWGNLCVAA